ncbi:MAG: PLP-dependent transferase [Pyrinomonadaceae bacterium]|nr:PLP-dependent transferase [Pyrinomonadaceae bacterium]
MKKKAFQTWAVHAGEDLKNNFGSLSVPVFSASVFAFSDADEGAALHNYEKEGFFYGRLGNPTQQALEKAVAELEGGECAYALASGMAAVSAAILSNVRSGDHIIAPDSMYSTTTLFLGEIGERYGIETTFVNAEDSENYARAIRENTKVLWMETPSNPTLQITDIRRVSETAKTNGAVSIIDNTFATPFNQRPLELGADMTVHSATKYLGGHSDLTAGVLTGNREMVQRARQTIGKLYGGNISPQVAWLVLRGIKTLALRMERHNHNAFAIAHMLNDHPLVSEVFYPGLEGHKNHEIAKSQMNGFGGMISFDVGTAEAGKKLVNSLELCTLATSLGGVESIVQHSASMTHATLSPAERASAGISDGLIRLSVGIEDKEDLVEDLRQALQKI